MATTIDEPQRATLRAAGVALLVGAAFLLAGNIAHPIDEAVSPTSRLPLATGGSWIVIHLVVGAGMGSVAIGIILLASSAGRVASDWLRTTVIATAAGGGLLMALVFVGLDGHGAASLATMEVAPELIEAAAIALNAIDTGASALGTLLLFGAGFGGVGAILLRSRVAARALGWAATLVGVLGTTTGAALAFAGATPTTINLLLRPMAVIATVTCVALSVSLLRGQRQVATPAAHPPGAIAG